MNISDYPDVGRVSQVAEVADVDPRTIRAEILRGNLDAVRIGSSIRVTKFALCAWLKIPVEPEIDPPEISPEGSPVHTGPGLRVVKGGP